MQQQASSRRSRRRAEAEERTRLLLPPPTMRSSRNPTNRIRLQTSVRRNRTEGRQRQFRTLVAIGQKRKHFKNVSFTFILGTGIGYPSHLNTAPEPDILGKLHDRLTYRYLLFLMTGKRIKGTFVCASIAIVQYQIFYTLFSRKHTYI
jgi:hypothetical protein